MAPRGSTRVGGAKAVTLAHADHEKRPQRARTFRLGLAELSPTGREVRMDDVLKQFLESATDAERREAAALLAAHPGDEPWVLHLMVQSRSLRQWGEARRAERAEQFARERMMDKCRRGDDMDTSLIG